MWGALANLAIWIFGLIFNRKTEDPGVKLGRTEVQRDAAEAEIVRVDKAIAARDSAPSDFDSLRDSPDNRARAKPDG